MSSMYQQYFAQKGLVVLPIVTMILFVLVFCAVTIRALRRAPASPASDVSRLPLEADDKGAHHG